LLLFYSCKTVPEVAFEKTQEKAVDKNPIQSDLIPLFNDLFNTYSIKVKIITTNEVCLRSDFVLNTIDFISGKQVSSFRDKMITILSKDKLCYYNDMVFTSPLVIKTDDFFPLYINNQMYYGEIRIYPKENGFWRSSGIMANSEAGHKQNPPLTQRVTQTKAYHRHCHCH